MSAAQRTRHNTFTDIGLDRAAERRHDQDWLAQLQQSPQCRYLVVDADGQVLVNADGEAPCWLDASSRARVLPHVPASLLGVDGESAHFLIHVDHDNEPALAKLEGVQRMGLRKLADQFNAFDAGLCAYACGLAHWQASMRYCNSCGANLAFRDAGHRAQCSNEACAKMHFPRTDPAIIVIVEHDGACLLGRQANWPQELFSTLAGFVEPGEALEDAVRREVAEESGVEVIDCEYHSSQPWPFPASLMLGFTATASGRDVALRDGELAEARWFTPEDIVAGLGNGSLKLPSSLSVSWHLLDHWLRERGGIALDTL
ncbi:MAG: NAD(+) diphosphatase [Rhodanobacteraceae bacterium]